MRGAKANREAIVVYARPKAEPPSRAGFVVSKKVGNAVERNRVKRRLRHLAAPILAASPVPVDIVVRALPGALKSDLDAQLASGVDACYRKLGI
jgi:ribonuclease P protein component